MGIDLKLASELIVSKSTDYSVSSLSPKDLLITGKGGSSEKSDSGCKCTYQNESARINFHDLSFVPELDNTANQSTADISNLLKRVAALEHSHYDHENISNHISSLSSRMSSLENKANQIINNLDFMMFQFKENQESVLQLSNQLKLFHSALSTDLDILKNDVNCIGRLDTFKQDFSVAKDNLRDTSLPIPLQSPARAGSSTMFAECSEAVDLSNVSVLHSSSEHYMHDSMVNANATYSSIHFVDESFRPMVSQIEPNFEPQVFIPTGFVPSFSTDSVQGQCSQIDISSDSYLNHAEEQQHPPTTPDLIQPGENDYIPNVHGNSVDKILNIQSKLLNSQMIGLRSLISLSPNEGLSRATLLDIHNNRVEAVEHQTHNLQTALYDYVKVDGFSLELCDQVTDVISQCISWSSKIRELYQSTGVYKRSQGSKLFDSLQIFSPNSEIDIFIFLKRFESSTSEFDFPEERAELLYNKLLSSSIQEEIIRYKNDYKSMKSFLIQRYGNPRILISKMLKPLQELNIPDNMSDAKTCHSYYRKLHCILEKINLHLDPQTGYQDDFESYIFSQGFIHTLLGLIPSDAKLEFFKAMKHLNQDTLWIKGEMAFKQLLSTVHDCYELHDRLSFFQSASESRSDVTSTVSTSRNGNMLSCQTGTVVDTSTGMKFDRIISDYEYPCILPGHDHSIGNCKQFFRVDSTQRVNARKSSKVKHCAICLQSSNLCRGGKCANVRSVPDILICHDCKQMNVIDRKRPFYSVLFCMSQSHRKPHKLDLSNALESYIPGFKTLGDSITI